MTPEKVITIVAKVGFLSKVIFLVSNFDDFLFL